jgi:hypothetical protein
MKREATSARSEKLFAGSEVKSPRKPIGSAGKKYTKLHADTHLLCLRVEA